MKPTFHFNRRTDRASSAGGAQSRSLQTDCQFQAGANFPGSRQGGSVPPFRRLSENYFRGEGRSHFAMEAAIFGLIGLTAAIPVFESIQGLVRFVYGTL